jgi:hypothetical protein
MSFCKYQNFCKAFFLISNYMGRDLRKLMCMVTILGHSMAAVDLKNRKIFGKCIMGWPVLIYLQRNLKHVFVSGAFLIFTELYGSC